TVIKDPGVHPDAKIRMWASHDGRTFAATSEGLSRPTVYQMRASGWLVNPSPCTPPCLGPEGDTVFGAGQMAGPTGTALAEKRFDRGKAVWYLPAVQGPFFVAVHERTFGQWPNEKKWAEVNLHAGRDTRPLATLRELPEAKDLIDFFSMRSQ